jgi:hypothetical protein
MAVIFLVYFNNVERLWILVRFPAVARNFSLLRNFQIGWGSHSHLFNGYQKSFPEGKVAGAWGWPHASIANVKSEWSYNFGSPYVFMLWTATTLRMMGWLGDDWWKMKWNRYERRRPRSNRGTPAFVAVNWGNRRQTSGYPISRLRLTLSFCWSHPEILLDVVHLGPGDLSPVLSKTSQCTLVARVNVWVVAHLRVLTQRAQIGVPRLCKQQQTGWQASTDSNIDAKRQYVWRNSDLFWGARFNVSTAVLHLKFIPRRPGFIGVSWGRERRKIPPSPQYFLT